jgi:hypothetical protein
MDIRGRCDPIIDNENFLKCQARLDTALFHLQNNVDFHNEFQRPGSSVELVSLVKKHIGHFNMLHTDIVKICYAYKAEYQKTLENSKMIINLGEIDKRFSKYNIKLTRKQTQQFIERRNNSNVKTLTPEVKKKWTETFKDVYKMLLSMTEEQLDEVMSFKHSKDPTKRELYGDLCDAVTHFYSIRKDLLKKEFPYEFIGCEFCGTTDGCIKYKLCRGCKKVYYCSIECHKLDWKEHKLKCLCLHKL